MESFSLSTTFIIIGLILILPILVGLIKRLILEYKIITLERDLMKDNLDVLQVTNSATSKRKKLLHKSGNVLRKISEKDLLLHKSKMNLAAQRLNRP